MNQIIKSNLRFDTIAAARSFMVYDDMEEDVYLKISNAVVYTTDFTQMMC